VYKVLMGKLEGKTPLGKQRRRWVDGIRMDHVELGGGGGGGGSSFYTALAAAALR
jgi:hypothetical protein